MTRVALAGLLRRKLRASLTAIAIVLGVAMIAGTLVLTDSIDQAFKSIFTDVRQGSDVVVSGKSAFTVNGGSGTQQPTLRESLLAQVRALSDVREAEGSVNGEAQLIGKNGKAIVYGGAPNLGFSIANPISPFNPLTLVSGAWPKANEVVVDKSTAGKEHLEVGQLIGVQAEGPETKLRISGIVKFGSVATIGGATLAGFDLSTAQKLFDKPRQLDEIAIAAKTGVSDPALLNEVRAILPPTAQARTAQQQAKKDAEDTNSFISFLRTFLLAFGGIALFVGSFVIANSLSITIAQRTREFATLRTLGATRRQVLYSVVTEALVVGALASLIGLGLGFLLAKGLFSLFDAVGFTLPNSGLLLETKTVVIALAVGIGVTLLASLRPAFRATRVPPIAAVREGAVLPEGRFARYRTPWSIALTTLGFAALLYGLFVPGLGTSKVLIALGIGALLIFFGVALFSARIARPLANFVNPIGKWVVVVLSVLFWPFFIFPYWALRYGAFSHSAGAGKRIGAFLLGLVLNPVLAVIVVVMWIRSKVTSWKPDWPLEFPGVIPDRVTTQLARDNAQRNPQRTASTASALMIGLALVTLVAVLAAGITQTFRGAVNQLWGGADYAITAQNNFSPIPTSAAQAVAKAPGVIAVGNVRTGDARAFGSTFFATAVDPPTASIFDIKWKNGTTQVLAQLGENGAFVDDGYAKTHHLQIGSPLDLTFATGVQKRFLVKGIFNPPPGGSPFGHVTISAAAWDHFNENPKNLYSFVKMRGGVTPENTAVLERQLASFPNAKSATKKKFIDNQISGLNSILNILYVLLALSVLVSFVGIVNTLVLTVFERTRELGMLRAVGMTRGQVKRMIRQESVITALIGGVLGIVLGLVLGGLLVARVDFIEFTVPVPSLIVFAIAAIVVGIVAAVFPARRAAKLNVLEALQYE